MSLKMMLMKKMQSRGKMLKQSKKKSYVLYHFDYIKRMQRMKEIHQMFRVLNV